jgi:hypothetical protein
METEQTPKPQSTPRKLAKGAITLAVAAVATYGALKPEEVAREAIAANTASHRALADRVEALQRWAESNRKAAEGAREECTAKAATLTSFVTGYLMALSAARSARTSRVPRETPQEIKELVRALSKPRPVQKAQKALPKLAPMPEPPHKKGAY